MNITISNELFRLLQGCFGRECLKLMQVFIPVDTLLCTCSMTGYVTIFTFERRHQSICFAFNWPTFNSSPALLQMILSLIGSFSWQSSQTQSSCWALYLRVKSLLFYHGVAMPGANARETSYWSKRQHVRYSVNCDDSSPVLCSATGCRIVYPLNGIPVKNCWGTVAREVKSITMSLLCVRGEFLSKIITSQ